MRVKKPLYTTVLFVMILLIGLVVLYYLTQQVFITSTGTETSIQEVPQDSVSFHFS
ncbi:MAG: hypothetical protein WBA16_01455 [Nonlabens sp.]